MKKLLLASFILLSATTMATSNIAEVEGQIDAKGVVIPQVNLCAEGAILDFGIMLPGEKHTTNVDAGCSGAYVSVQGSSAAGIDVSGATVVVTCDATVNLSNTSANDGTYFNAKLFIDGTIGNTKALTLGTNSMADFTIHGKMTDAAPDSAGLYEGKFTVTAFYDSNAGLFVD